MQPLRVLSYAELAEPARWNVQLTHRFSTPREQHLLEDGINPGAGDDAGDVGRHDGVKAAAALEGRHHLGVQELRQRLE